MPNDRLVSGLDIARNGMSAVRRESQCWFGHTISINHQAALAGGADSALHITLNSSMDYNNKG